MDEQHAEVVLVWGLVLEFCLAGHAPPPPSASIPRQSLRPGGAGDGAGGHRPVVMVVTRSDLSL
jgi:hypothetical protein